MDKTSAMDISTVKRSGIRSMVFLAFAALLWTEVGAQFFLPGEIPIGAILDQVSLKQEAALRYKESQFNRNKGRYKEFNLTVQMPPSDSINLSSPNHLVGAMCKLMSRGIFAIIGLDQASTAAAAIDFANKLHMPYLTPSKGGVTHQFDNEYVINMLPDHLDAIIETIIYLRWNSYIYYVFNSEGGFSRFSYLNRRLEELKAPKPVMGYRLRNASDAYTDLRELDKLPQRFATKYIILDMADQTALEEVLRQIPVVGMNKIGYHYLLGTLAMDELDLTKYEYGGANVTGFNLLNYSDSTLRRFLRGWRKESPAKYYGAGTNRIQLQSALLVDSVSVLANAFNYMMERNPSIFRGIFRDGVVYNNDAPGILCRSPSPFPWHLGNEIISAIKQSHVSGLSGKIVFDRTGKRKNFTLSVTDVSLKGRSKVGEWSRERGFKGPNWFDTPKKNVTHRGNGSYIITMNEEEPYVMWKKQDNGEPLVGNDRFEGYCVDLTRELAAIANFRYTIKLVDDKMYGEYNGTHWDGMIGELTRGEADMAISSLTITAQRQRVVDFSKPFMRTGVSIMIKKPEKEKPGVFSFLDPLDEKIWMSIAFAFVGVSVVMFLVCRISPLEWNNEAQNGEVIELETVFSLKNSLWFSFGAVMQQGADVFPKSLSGRLVGTVWWFFSLIIISSYTANLAAFLTIERTNPRIRSAEDLAQQTEIEYGCMEGGSTAKFFKNSQFKTYQNMWAFMTSRPGVFVKSTDEGLKKLRESKGKYAFLLESTTNDYKNQKKPCDTMMVGPNIQNKGYGVATAVGLEPENLREKINLAILQLDERGILTKLKKKWWYDKGECAQKPDSKTNPLKLNNVAGVFYILIGGLMLAMLVSLFEFLYNARKEAKRSKGSFKNAVRSKARLSIAGPGEHEGDYAEECVAPPPSYGAAMGYIPSQTMVTFRGTERKTDTEV